MTEDEYKQEYLQGLYQTEYNACKFAEDKLQYCKNWLIAHNVMSAEGTFAHDLIKIICEQKFRFIQDKEYCKLCSQWTNKISVYSMLRLLGLESIQIPYRYYSYNKPITQQDIMNYCDIEQDWYIKCNHGSGWNILRKAGQPTDWVTNKINEWLQLNYAYISGYEAQYEEIVPGFLIQPKLHDCPIDYGFWCVNGDIIAVSLTKKLAKNLEQYLAFVDENGKALSWYIGHAPEMKNLPYKFTTVVQQMLPIVKTIAKQFDFVRVDMLYIDGRIYFEETTFTPCSGNLKITLK